MLSSLDLNQVAAFLSERLRRDVSEVVGLHGGEWSHAFCFTWEGSERVVRFGEFATDFEKDRLAYKYASDDLPIPRVIEIGEGLGSMFCISEKMPGEMLDGVSGARMAELVPAVLRMFDSLRQADVSAFSGFGGWNAKGIGEAGSWREFLLGVDEESPRVCGWHENMANSPYGSRPFERGLNYLRNHIGVCPEDRHLLHTDLLHFNVLVSGDRISGVFDWGNSMYGDFLYELALFTFYAPWYPAMKGLDWGALACRHYREIHLAVPDFEERLRCYEAHIGLSGMAYTAFKQNWVDFEWNAARMVANLR